MGQNSRTLGCSAPCATPTGSPPSPDLRFDAMPIGVVASRGCAKMPGSSRASSVIFDHRPASSFFSFHPIL